MTRTASGRGAAGRGEAKGLRGGGRGLIGKGGLGVVVGVGWLEEEELCGALLLITVRVKLHCSCLLSWWGNGHDSPL